MGWTHFHLRFGLSGARSLCRKIPLIIVDHFLQVPGLLAIDRAANCKACSKNLLCCALELICLTLFAHLPDNIEELILSDVSAVLDVLGLLAVTEWLLQILDDKTGGVGHHFNLCLTVLNCQLDSDSNALPGTSGLDNVIANLLW